MSLSENEIAKLFSKAGVTIEKQERMPENERDYEYRYRESDPFKRSRIEYDFVLPNRHDNPNVSRDLYRIRFPDGTVSDLANLARIKDAAIAAANRLLKQEEDDA